MPERFKWAGSACRRPQRADIAFLNREKAEEVRRWHASFDAYSPTPLAKLSAAAGLLGVKDIWVKDESYRFGLNAFKVLGGSYAMGRYIAGVLGKDLADLPYRTLISEEVKKELGPVTFVTATDGNHGRGVAWTARQLGQKAIVYMPRGSARERLENIRAEGALADITDLNYDDAVRLASRTAEQPGCQLVQDTAWEGYEDIPAWIMQGYMTMALEALEQLKGEKPTHIFLQAGVGSLAAALTGFFANVYGEDAPRIVIVEPDKADCIYRTALANDEQLHIVTGDMDTIMAGLACGEPNRIGWEVLRDYADVFVSCPDWAAAEGMRILASPAGEDDRVTAGESGASAFGCAAAALRWGALKGLKDALGLDENSRLLFFNTEGDTDKENYRRIVWDGAWPAPWNE